MKTWQAIFRGKVQGVGFRATVRRYALTLGIKGYVLNKADGSVELVAEAEKEHFDKLISSLKEFPKGARIKECQIQELPNHESFTHFAIRHEHP